MSFFLYQITKNEIAFFFGDVFNIVSSTFSPNGNYLNLFGKDVVQSKHPQIMQANEDFLSWQKVSSLIEDIKTNHEKLDDDSMRNVLIENVEGYKPAKN